MFGMVDRVSIFIDGSNFYHRLADMGIKRIDLPKLLQLISDNRKIVNIYYCDAPFKQRDPTNPVTVKIDTERYAHQLGWFNTVKKTPNINFKLYERDSKNKVKGDDIHLAVEMVKEAYENTYDTAILVTGDGDFKRAIEVVIGRGKEVENVYFKNSRSHHLRFVKGIEINRFIHQCKLADQPSATP